MNETLYVLWPAISLVSGVILLRLVGFLTRGLDFDSWGAAFGAVFIAYAVWWVAGSTVVSLISQLPDGHTELNALMTQAAIYAAVELLFNIVSLAVAGALLSAMHVKGVFGLLLSAVCLTFLNLAFVYFPLIRQALAG